MSNAILLSTLVTLLSATSSYPDPTANQDNETWLKGVIFPWRGNLEQATKDCATRGISKGNVDGWPRFEINRDDEYICRERFFSGATVKYNIGNSPRKSTLCNYATEMNEKCQPNSATSLYDFEAWTTYQRRKDSTPGLGYFENWFQPGAKSSVLTGCINKAVQQEIIADPHVEMAIEDKWVGEKGQKRRFKYLVATCKENYTGTGARVLSDDLSDYTLQYLYDNYDNPMIYMRDFVNWVAENTNCQPE